MLVFFFFKQKTAYEVRISDWSSDVCSSDVDVLHAVDMQAARGHVGGDQDLELALLELAQQRFALLLRHVARQHADPVTGAFERAGDAFDPGLEIGRASCRERVSAYV